MRPSAADTETTQLLKRIADHLSDLVTTIAAKDCKEGDSIKPMPFLKMEERIDCLLASKPIPDSRRIQLTDARFAIKRLFVRHGAKLNMAAIKNPCVTGALPNQGVSLPYTEKRCSINDAIKSNSVEDALAAFWMMSEWLNQIDPDYVDMDDI